MSAEAIAIGVAIWLLLVVAAAILLYGRFRTTVDHPERYHEGQTVGGERPDGAAAAGDHDAILEVYIDGRRYVITRVEGNRIRWRRG
jgi:hypothetical protein